MRPYDYKCSSSLNCWDLLVDLIIGPGLNFGTDGFKLSLCTGQWKYDNKGYGVEASVAAVLGIGAGMTIGGDGACLNLLFTRKEIGAYSGAIVSKN